MEQPNHTPDPSFDPLGSPESETASAPVAVTIDGTGASGMAQTFSESKNQGVIALSVGSQKAGTEILVKDAAGKVILSYAPQMDFAVLILSSPDLIKGESYFVTVGASSGEFMAD